ncbi:N-acetyltransferase [Jeotgalibacillus sp. S-D1]|uniref:GNAT family N-acetyltransferase n=1 Tax=Jeotgalibacillus sp. S-D1 TaxID=2552189 RepID=UPI00105A1CE1|nr:GNAT family protein [Jeotgalibacillus sp. S-D1]TDL31290.1 N-acetyltransferase [Jeotgalibacillus sp. S-D1]
MLTGNTVHIRELYGNDAKHLLKLERDNRLFFETFSMLRDDDFYTLKSQQERIRKYAEHREKDTSYNFGIFSNDENELIGSISLFQVMRGSLQNAVVGYFLDENHNGKGYTTEAVKLISHYAFSELKLHRLEAGAMPHNIGSIRVLEKAGFHKEGIAKKNVKINGKWEDHQVLALINPEDD